jgi:hypothetical protein
MEFYQVTQTRAAQTVAVIKQFDPGLTVGGSDIAGLTAQANALEALAQLRDHALADYDAASNAEYQGFLTIQTLDFALPKAAESELDDTIDAESALLDLLSPAYAIKPRSTEFALARGKKLVSALTRINAYLGALNPPRPLVSSGGKGLEQLAAALDAQPALQQALEDRAADVANARNALRIAATTVDRLNKRFYARLKAEARSNPSLEAALAQIDTGSAGLPAVLGIKTLVQGGADNLHILLNYDPGSYDGTADSSVEWHVVGAEADFANTVKADPSGNALGPFAVGNTVKLRTRVKNSNGTTTGSVRSLVIQ